MFGASLNFLHCLMVTLVFMILIVPYDQLKEDLMGVFERVIDFTNIKPSHAPISAVRNQAEKQKKYHRQHEVRPLKDFGIDSRRLKEDFAFLYANDPYPVHIMHIFK